MGIMRSIAGHSSEVPAAELTAKYGTWLLEDESIHSGYKVFRDTFMFTNLRLILIDHQGMSGKKVDFRSFPWKSVSHFAVETPESNWSSFMPDAELKIWIGSHGEPISKNMGKEVDVRQIQALIAYYTTQARPAG